MFLVFGVIVCCNFLKENVFIKVVMLFINFRYHNSRCTMKTLLTWSPQTLPHGPCFRSTDCQYAVPYHKVSFKTIKIVVNEGGLEWSAVNAFTLTITSHWFKHCIQMTHWSKFHTKEVEVLTDHINKTDCDVIHCDPTRGCQWTKLPFQDQPVHINYQRSLSIEAYTKLASTDQYLLSDSHKPLEHKRGVNRILLQELNESKEKTCTSKRNTELRYQNFDWNHKKTQVKIKRNNIVTTLCHSGQKHKVCFNSETL